MFAKLIKLPVKLHKPIPCDDDTSDDVKEKNSENHIVNNFWNNKYTIHGMLTKWAKRSVCSYLYSVNRWNNFPVSSSSSERAFSKLK
jgi:hypothetical protein